MNINWFHKGKVYELQPTSEMTCEGCSFDGSKLYDLGMESCPEGRKDALCEEVFGHAIWVEKTPAAPKQTEMLLPTDAAERKKIPIVSGVLDYFPLAIAEVAKCSLSSNEQHNPGQPLHWDRTKSTDHIDCIGRHIVDRGKFDDDGQRHSAKLAWRALALLQLELEAEKGKEYD